MIYMDYRESKKQYTQYIKRHINNVKKAYELIKNKCEGMTFTDEPTVFIELENEIKNHDKSKWSKEEFESYRQYFFTADGEIKNKELFKKAWEHHKENNPHHWQVWTSLDICEQQKEIYFIANMCDWIAMSMDFGGTAKDYYEKNKEEIKLPERYINYMYKIFEKIY